MMTPERAEIGRVLDVELLRVGQPDHRNRAGVRAGGDHRLDILELERAVLHLEPGVVVMLGLLAIAGDIELGLREAEDLLAFEQLLLGGVVQLRLFARGLLGSVAAARQRSRRIARALRGTRESIVAFAFAWSWKRH